MTSPGHTPIPNRAQHVLARDVGDEIVVLDEEAEQVHLLKETAADVWRAAESGTPLPASADVEVAVAEMTELGLLQGQGLTRRKMLRSATVLAGVGLTTIAMPMAAAHASGPAATRSPSSGVKGVTVVTVSGTGWAVNQNIAIKLGSVTVAFSTAKTNNNGSGSPGAFTGTFTVPNNAALVVGQSYSIDVTVNGQTASAGLFTITG